MTNRDVLPPEQWQAAREEQHRIRLNAIVDLASELFNTKGYFATSLSDVAERLSITKAALYYYVKNKEDLIYRCAIRSTQQVEDVLAGADREGKNGLAKIEALFRELLEQKRGPIIVMSEMAALLPNHQGELEQHRREVEKTITRFIREGIADRTIADRDPKLLVLWIMGAMNWAPKWYPAESKVSPDRLAQSFLDLIVEGLRARHA